MLNSSPGIPALRETITFVLEQYESGKEHNLQALGREPLYRVLSQEQLKEIWIRNGVEILFEKALEGLLPLPKIKALKRVMFEKLYRLEFGGRLRQWRDADEDSLVSVLD